MALNPIEFLVAASATATNGSNIITIAGNVDASRVYSGTAISFKGTRIVEAVGGTAPDGSGNSTITLRSVWDDTTVTAQQLTAFNTIEGLEEAIRRAREIVENSSAIEDLVGTGLVNKTGTNTYSIIPMTTAGQDLITAADSSSQRALLGLGSITSSEVNDGVLYTELGLSLTDQGRSPSYSNSGVNQRQYLSKGITNWLKRRTKNGFTYLYTAGKSGDTVEGALARFQTDVIDQPIRPQVVNLFLGGNDINAVNSYVNAELELGIMISELDQIIDLATQYSMKVLISTMPNNARWLINEYKIYLECEWQRHLNELARKGRITAYLNYATLFITPEATRLHTQVPMSRLNNIITVDLVGHGYTTGDRVIIVRCNDATFDTFQLQEPAASITVVTGSRFTYPSVGSDSPARVGDVVKVNIDQELTDDITTHFSPKGASKGALIAEPQFKALFPPRDILSHSENDLNNFFGTGKARSQFRPNLGMMYGNGGTLTGTVVPTGVAPSGWTVKGENGDIGSASIVCSIIPHPDKSTSQYLMQRMVVDGGTLGLEVQFHTTLSVPNVWLPSDSIAGGSSRIPSVANGYFYVSESTSTETSGLTEPVWPTRIGEKVLDTSGNFSWMCRRGFITGTTKVYGAAEYFISQMDDDAIRSLSWGFWDNTVASDSVVDFDNDTNTNHSPPLFLEGENGHFCTPETTLGSSGSNWEVGMKLQVMPNKTCTIDICRATSRVVV